MIRKLRKGKFDYTAKLLKRRIFLKEEKIIDLLKNMNSSINIEKSKETGIFIENGELGNYRTLFLNNVHNKNRLTNKMACLISLWAELLSRHDNVHCLFLDSTTNNFCPGRDWSFLKSDSQFSDITQNLKEEIWMYHSLINAEIPVCVFLNGKVGLPGIAMSKFGDVSVASIDSTFSVKEAFSGWLPDSGMTYHLSRIKYHGVGLWLALTGTPIDAVSMKNFGLIDYVVPSKRCFEEIRREIGSNANARKFLIRKVICNSIQMFAQYDFSEDNLKRYLPFIDLCFGDLSDNLTICSIAKRLRFVANNSAKEALRIRMENGNFRYEKFFLEQVDEKNLPKELAEWAKKCLKSIACLNMTDANLILEAFKKSAKDEKIEYSLEREFDIAKQSLRARQHKIENGDLSMKAAIDNFESFKDKSVEELEEKIFEDNLIVAKDQAKTELFLDKFESNFAHPRSPLHSGLTYEQTKTKLTLNDDIIREIFSNGKLTKNINVPPMMELDKNDLFWESKEELDTLWRNHKKGEIVKMKINVKKDVKID